MKQRISFLIKFFLFWLIYFVFFRVVFLVYQLPLTRSISVGEVLKIFTRGLWMDSSLAGYILLLASLFMALLFFADGRWLRKVYTTYTVILLVIFSVVAISDLELYRNWGFRIDATPLLYLKTPKDAMASLKGWVILVLAIAAGITVISSMFLYRKWVAKPLRHVEKGKWWYFPIFVFLAACMIIPIRGGFGIAPMNPGKVYFSQNTYCNHAALNPVWNMMYSVSKSGKMSKQYPTEIAPGEAKQLFTSMMESDSTNYVLSSNRPNIVVILLESFSAKLIEPLGGKSGVTPCFNKLSEQGILFTNTFASGDRSDKGIIAVLSGFPAQPTQSIIKYPTKSRKLPTISGVLAENGYNNTFYYGGDPDFANIRSFLYHARFNRLVTQDDFPKKYRNSKWGVHDGYVFDYLLTDLDSAKAPFFKFFFTLSSHEPFEIPAQPKFKGTDEVNQYLSSAYYTDSCLGNFFDIAQKKEWYKNTIFILIADHGHRHLGNHPNYAIEKFHIPMLWLGGALSVKPTRMEETVSQIDLASTLLNQLNLSDLTFIFSKNVLSNHFTPFAYYAFNEGFGFKNNTDTVIFDLAGRNYIKKKGVTPDTTARDAWAFFSKYQDAFLGF